MTSAGIREWAVYAVLLKRPNGWQSEHEEAGRGMRFHFRFDAPARPGRYRVVYHKVPWFTATPLRNGRPLREPSLVSGRERDQLVETTLAQGRDFHEITDFSVTAGGPREPNLTLYLRANGAPPTYTPIKGGLSERPMRLSWYVGVLPLGTSTMSAPTRHPGSASSA